MKISLLKLRQKFLQFAEFLSVAFLIKISFLFVKRGAGRGRFRGELRSHAKTEGTTPGFKDTTRVRVILKSSSLKCLEQTLVEFDVENFFLKSLLIA